MYLLLPLTKGHLSNVATILGKQDGPITEATVYLVTHQNSGTCTK